MNIKKYVIQFFIVLLAFLFVYITLSHRKKGEYIYLTGFCQGTTYHITYEGKKGENLQPEINSILAEFDLTFSTYNRDSVISRLNRNAPDTRVDEDFIKVFDKSYEVYRKTGGAFDITVGPVVNALGFGNTDSQNTDDRFVAGLMKYVGMDKVRLEKDRLVKADKNVVLDMNGIAQGYSVDLVAGFLEGRGIRNYLVEIGGETRCRGKNPNDRIWRIGLDRPVEGNTVPGADLQVIIELDGKAISTSGNYRKYYEKDGKKIVHIVDPKTGHPVESNLLSVTIVADDCLTSDAYDTPLMVLGLDKSIEFLKSNRFLEGYLIYTDGEGRFQAYATPGFKRLIVE